MSKHFKYGLLSAISIALLGCNGDNSLSGDDNNGNDSVVTESYCEIQHETLGDKLFFCDDFSGNNYNLAVNWQSNGESANGVFVVEDNILWYETGTSGGQLLKATSAVSDLIPASGDYYVEARIRLRNNNDTSSKRTYLLGRYNDSNLAYSAGFNTQTATESQRAVMGYINAEGTAEYETAIPYAFDLGSKHSYLDGSTHAVASHSRDGSWYKLRLLMSGSVVSMYINDVLINSYDGADSSAGMTYLRDPGSIGFYSKNRAFEVDYVMVGDATDLPASVSLNVENGWDSMIGDELTVTVSAVKEGGDADTVIVTNSNSAVVDVVEGANNMFTLKALAAGTANLAFALSSDSKITTTLSINVNESVVLPTTDYGDISAKVTPTVHAQNQQVDVTLSVNLEGTPILGERGIVYIYDANTKEVVQELNVAGDETVLAGGGKEYSRKYFPMVLDGNTLTIYPKNSAFIAGKQYYIAMTQDVINGATLNGKEFIGFGMGDWAFSIGDAVETGKVALNIGPNGDFATVQGALSYIMADATLKNVEKTITLENGIYNEMLFLRNVNNLTIKGTSREGTIIQHDNHEARNGGSSGRPLMLVESVDMLTFENLTIRNTHIRTGASDQAEVIYFNSDNGRLIAKNANFYSEQDTLNLKGYSWFYNTLIAGNVDFIWGSPKAALFENSEIRTIADSKVGSADIATDGGYVLQARASSEDAVGFVFLNSIFTSGKGVLGNSVKIGSTYLARSSGSTSYFDNITVVNCTLGDHFASVGWAGAAVDKKPNPSTATVASGWRIDEASLANSPITNMTAEAYQLTSAEKIPYASREAVMVAYGSDLSWLTAE